MKKFTYEDGTTYEITEERYNYEKECAMRFLEFLKQGFYDLDDPEVFVDVQDELLLCKYNGWA